MPWSAVVARQGAVDPMHAHCTHRTLACSVLIRRSCVRACVRTWLPWAHGVADKGPLVAPPDAHFRARLRANRAGRIARKSLDTAQHWQFACVGQSNRDNCSLEQANNELHLVFPADSLMFEGVLSAFHPAFWLHRTQPLNCCLQCHYSFVSGSR
jgi:hypothetical protein